MSAKDPSRGNLFFPVGIFFSALAFKLIILFMVTEPIIFFKYPYFAEKIAQGLDIGERILDLSPFYLYLHLLYYRIYGSQFEGMVLFQILLGSLNCLLVYFIGEKVFGRSVGIIAAFLLIFYGNLTLLELTLEPEVLVLLFNSLIVLSLLWAGEKGGGAAGGRSRWLMSGSLLGLAVLLKPNALLFLPAALIWITLLVQGGSKKKAILSLVLGTILLVSPITIRNYVKFNDLVLVTGDLGKVFFHGNGPGATGLERADLPDQGFLEEGVKEPDYAHVLFREKARMMAGGFLMPSGCSRFWTRYTLNYLISNPLSALNLWIKKIYLLFNSYEIHDLDASYKYYRTMQRWPLLPFGVLSVLGMLGVGLALKKWRDFYFPLAGVLIYLFTAVIFIPASRYRLPAVPFLALFAAYALITLFRVFQKRRWKVLGLYTLILFLVTALSHAFYLREIRIFDQWQEAARIHYSLGGNGFFKKGCYPEAIREYQKAVELAPDFAPAYNRLGQSYALSEDWDRAEASFKKVILLSPEVDQGYLNLGLLYKLKGNLKEANPLLQKALSLNPQNEKARKHLKTDKSKF